MSSKNSRNGTHGKDKIPDTRTGYGLPLIEFQPDVWQRLEEISGVPISDRTRKQIQNSCGKLKSDSTQYSNGVFTTKYNSERKKRCVAFSC